MVKVVNNKRSGKDIQQASGNAVTRSLAGHGGCVDVVTMEGGGRVGYGMNVWAVF